MSGQQELYNHAKDFREKVANCIDSSDEVLSFYQVLKAFNSDRNIDQLIKGLGPIINTPKRHVLFAEVGSLIGVDDRDIYYSKIPPPPSDGIRIVKVKRIASESFGFGIRGGKEHKTGIFVSTVHRGSRADIAGLKVGDEILLVNGYMISESTHNEVVSLMRNKRNLRLKIRSAQKYPEMIGGKLSWKMLDGKENMFLYHPALLNHLVSQLSLVRSHSPLLHIRETDKHVKFIVGPMGLGCSVRNGIPTKYGVFVIHVSEGSLAERVGVSVGDQIIALNKRNFSAIKYSEAVQLLKNTKEFDMILRPCKEAREFVEFSRSKGYEIVSKSNPSSPIKESSQLVQPIKNDEKKQPVVNGTHKPSSESFYSKFKRTGRKQSASKKSESEEDTSTISVKNDVSNVSETVKDKPLLTTTQTSDEITTHHAQTEIEPSPVATDTSNKPRSESIYSKVKRSTTRRSSSKNRGSKKSESDEEKAVNLTFSAKALEGREPKQLNVEKRDVLFWVLDAKDDRIFVQIPGQGELGPDSGVVKNGDQLLAIGNVSVVGLSLRQAQSVVDDMCKREQDTVSVIVAEALSGTQTTTAVVSSNWSFGQKDLSNIEHKDLIFDTKF